MNFITWLENDQLATFIKSLYDADQAERNQYTSYLKKFPDWRTAAAAWLTSHPNRSAEDVFGDKERLKQAKQLIVKNIDAIKLNPQMFKMSWLLVQHMDNDVQFQQWFLKQLKVGSEQHRYLTDRILVNRGLQQKYNTQNV